MRPPADVEQPLTAEFAEKSRGDRQEKHSGENRGYTL